MKGSKLHKLILVTLTLVVTHLAFAKDAVESGEAKENVSKVTKRSESSESKQSQTENTEAVNVNTAPAEEIADKLQGIGLARAQAIVKYREQNGPFKAVADITAVKGVGEKILDKNKDLIKVE